MRIIAIFLFALFSPAVYADEKVAGVKEGEPAPFDGTCFNIEASARIITELENAETACNIKIEKELGTQAAEYDLKISNLEASLVKCNSICDERISVYKDQSLYLQDQLKKQKSLHPAWTFVAGVIVGSAMTMGTTYAVVQITQN